MNLRAYLDLLDATRPTEDPWLILLAILAGALCLGVASGLHRLRRGLLPTGLLPQSLAALQAGLRIAALGLLGVAILGVVPRTLLPLVPLGLIALTLTAGWSARGLVLDWVAGITILLEGRIRPGVWLQAGEVRGVVVQVGSRTTWLRDDHDRRLAIPNRDLLRLPRQQDDSAWPLMAVELRVQSPLTSDDIRQRLLEAAMLSPWRAWDTQPTVVRHGEDATRWRVEWRTVDVRFHDVAEEAFRELVEETFRGAEGPTA